MRACPRCGGKIKHRKGQVVAKLKMEIKVWEKIIPPILRRSARPIMCLQWTPWNEVDVHQGGYLINPDTRWTSDMGVLFNSGCVEYRFPRMLPDDAWLTKLDRTGKLLKIVDYCNLSLNYLEERTVRWRDRKKRHYIHCNKKEQYDKEWWRI